MNLKESYQQYLPIADKVAKEHSNFRSRYLREDILSNARLNVFEFCHKVLPTLDSERGGNFWNPNVISMFSVMFTKLSEMK